MPTHSSTDTRSMRKPTTLVAAIAALSIALVGLPVTSTPARAADPAVAPGFTVNDLTTEHLVDPIGIGTEVPRLSWKLDSAERDQAQTAYEIRVAESATGVADGTGLVWDSGKVAGDAQTLVEYAGEPLESNTSYFWQVRSWDSADVASSWSAVTTFDTALLQPSDWTAKWINPTGAMAGGGSYLRTEFTLADDPARARIYISARGAYERGADGQGICCEQDFGLARGIYELYANGERVGDAEFESQPVDSRVKALYRTWDVTDLLDAGSNALGVTIGEDSDVLVQLEVELANGDHLTVSSDNSWQTAKGPTTIAHKYHGETYDARKQLAGWNQPGLAAAGWTAADVIAGAIGRMDAAPNEPMEIIRTITPVTVTEPTAGVYVLDFGQNISGRAQLTTTLPAGATVTLAHGERLSGGRVDNGIIGARQTATVIGDGQPLVFSPSYTYAGFRWVEVSGLGHAPVGSEVVAQEIHNAVAPTGSFSSSDAFLNRLHKANTQTQVNGLHGLPEDTPTREKRGWMADAHVAAEATMNNYDMAGFYTKWVQDITDATAANGKVPDIVPNELGGGWVSRSDPAWASATVLVPYYSWKYYDDLRIIEEHYDAMDRWMTYVGTTTTDYLVTNPTGHWGDDWLSLETTYSKLFRSGYYYWGAEVLAETAAALGNTADVAKYDLLASRIKTAINSTFFDSSTASYGPSQFANAFPLVLGLVPAGREADVVDTLVENVMVVRQGHFTGGLPGIKYIPEALEKYGRSDVVLSVVSNMSYPGWGYMLENGPGTIWEDWGGVSSLNHPMFTSIDNWLYTAVAGIEQAPGSTGYKEIIFAPQVTGQLTSATASQGTRRGTASIDWSKGVDGVSADITVPVGATATLRLPQTTLAAVTESGWIASEAIGVRSIVQNGTSVDVVVGSGDYSFASDARLAALVNANDAVAAISNSLASLPTETRAELDAPTAAATSALGLALASYRADAGGAVPAVREALATVKELLAAVGEAEEELTVEQHSALRASAVVALNALSYFLGETSGITVTATTAEGVIAPGGSLDLTITVTNNGSEPVTDIGAELAAPERWTVSATTELPAGPLAPGETAVGSYSVSAPEDAEDSGVVGITVSLTVAGDPLVRNVPVTLAVATPLRADNVRSDPTVVEPGGTSFVRTDVHNVLASTRASGTMTIENLPAGWTAEPDVSFDVPVSGMVTASLKLTSSADAVGGVVRAVVKDEAGKVVSSAPVTLSVRGSANCQLDLSGAACLPDTSEMLFSFETGTDGWVAGENTSLVNSVTSFANGPSTAVIGKHVLEALPQGSPAANAYRTTSVTPENPIPTGGAHSLVLHADSYGGGGSSYMIRVRIVGADGAVVETETATSPDAWNRISVPLAGLGGEAIASIAVSFKGSNAGGWPARFQVDGVSLDSSVQLGPNIALGKSVTALHTLNCCDWGVEKLTDGRQTSGPGSNGYTSDPVQMNTDSLEWVRIDLGSAQDIGRVLLYPRTAHSGEAEIVAGGNFPNSFEIRVSDNGTDWTTAGTFTGQESDNGTPRTYRLDPGTTGRYVQVYVTTLGRGTPEQGPALGGMRLQLAEIEVYGPIDVELGVSMQPQSIVVEAGEDARFSVRGAGDPQPTVQWQRSVDGGPFEDIVGGVGSELLLPSVQLADSGLVVRARVSNGGAAELYSDEAELTVTYEALVIASEPADVWRETAATGPVEFSVQVSGTGLRLQWQRNLAGTASWAAIPGANAAELSLLFEEGSVSFGDSVRLVASNGLGEQLLSSPATIRELMAPTITDLPATVAVRPGVQIDLAATVGGAPEPEFQWFSRPDADAAWVEVPGGTDPELSFVAALSDNGSQYQLRASSTAGEITSDIISITVREYLGDETAPVVWSTISNAGTTGWYLDGARVTLEATDDDAGVDKIEYRLTGGDWTAYGSPFLLPEGTTLL